jgi:putative hydrolases of HD superfamily
MIATLLEIQRLKRLDRTGWPLRGLPAGTESVAAHSYGVTIVSMILADKIQGKGGIVEVERLLRIAVLHDLAEVRTGDLPRIAAKYYGVKARKDAERAAFNDIVEPLGENIRAIYNELHEDYEERDSLEARLVKAADVIDLLAQILLFERSGICGLDEFWEGAKEIEFQLNGIAHEEVDNILQQLFEEHRKVQLKIRGSS